MLNMNNLKKLYKLVTRYYEEVLGYPASNLAEPNLSSIAKNEDYGELIKFCHLILTLAVQCERNQVYIGKIMSLGEDDQRSLMVSIESVLAQLGSADPDTEADADQDVAMIDAAHNHSGGSDPVVRLQAELMKSYAEKDELERSAMELSVEHKQVQTKYEELLVLNEELKARMEDLEKSMARADKTGRADFLLRTEIENLKHELEKADVRYQEADHQQREQNATIAEMKRQLEETSAAQDEAVRLRDQLQEYKHAAERLTKSEHVIEKYKKKLEEGADLRRQVRVLEEQLATAKDHSRQIEEEYKRLSQMRSTKGSRQGDDYVRLESAHGEAMAELGHATERFRKAEAECERLQQEKQCDQEQIHTLEESLRELELRGTTDISAAATASGSLEAMDTTDQDDRVSLLTKIAKLERELKAANDSSNGDGVAAGFLEEVADAATLAKDEAIQDAASARAELREVAETLAATKTEYSKIQGELETENRQLKEALQLHQQGSKSGYSESDIGRLQSELVKSRDEVHSLHLNLKRTKDHCLELDRKLQHYQQQRKERDSDCSGDSDYREALQSLQSQISLKEEQLDSMRSMLREQNSAHLLESRMMASAWLNLQRQLERQSGFGHSSGMGPGAGGSGAVPGGRSNGDTPVSWLGQQRATLDMQLAG